MSKNFAKLLIIIIILYIFVSFFFLDTFPFVHSDETWLGSLSNEMLENATIQTTEPVFDLYPRNPHAIKLIFNFIQIIFIQLFGFSIRNLRLISLIFSMLSAGLLGRIIYRQTQSRWITMSIFIAFIINVQFIYVSHFARQESLILFLLLLNIDYLSSHAEPKPLFSGIISSIAIGIHPNSFIIFLPILAFWLLKMNFKKVVQFLLPISLFAIFIVSFSFLLDPNFISNYLNYGEELGVTATGIDKFTMIKDFYLKLYYGISGTYYTPDIKIYYYVFALFIIASILLSIKRKHSPLYLMMFIAINIGYIAIGRYNQTSIVFILPILFIILAQVLQLLDMKYRKFALFLILLISILNTYQNLNIHPSTEHYDDYIQNIQNYVPDNSIVLGNLNTIMAFENSQIYDYRNLGYLDTSIDDYIIQRDIEYIIYPEEMDFIYLNRPLWNGLYGNLFPYYDSFQSFLKTKCDLIGTFESPVYAMRIVRYIENKNYTIKIYKVK